MGVEPKLRPLLICRGQPGLDNNRIRLTAGIEPAALALEASDFSTKLHKQIQKAFGLLGGSAPRALVIVIAASLKRQPSGFYKAYIGKFLAN